MQKQTYREIISELANYSQNSGQLESRLYKPQSVIYRQLVELEKKGYIYNNSNYNRKKQYKLNKEKILTELKDLDDQIHLIIQKLGGNE